ncbi:MAG TPA: BTAD domain-containing putative transcriptional regulator [Nocardioides sp.]|jgi:DNA-binding SARP family transcriptional activator|nr:BTAD domain-containing putative transcriptional regulator [Nocardioides sp.]
MTEPLVRLLGGVAVRRADGSWVAPARLDALVLACLTLAEGRTIAVDDLIDALWGDHSPEQARNALQVKVSRLRALLGDRAAALTHSPGGYRLELAARDTDAGRFVEELEEGRRLLAADPSAAAACLESALARWQGDPLADLGDHPRLVAARNRLGELRLVATEARAEALITDPGSRPHAIAELRSILETDPLRPGARVLLMEALDRSGRRAEALAVYDAGRRLYAQTAGLEPPDEVRVVFERLLDAEREASRRAAAPAVTTSTGPRDAVPEGLAETARWVAEDGDVDAALALALRGTWWWWLSGRRGLGRDLLVELVEHARAGGGVVDGRAVLSARAWTSVFESLGTDATAALERGRRTLELVGRPSWNRHDCLAATLVAERLLERGDPAPARELLDAAGREQARRGDEWGQAFCALVAARGLLRTGDLTGARAKAEVQLRRFLALGDLAGQASCLDVIGYAAEALGDLVAAAQAHERAVGLARRAGAPEWEAGHLVRLGNVGVLAERPEALAGLLRAEELGASLGANSVTAYCRNGIGVAHAFSGDAAAAAEQHRAALAWYDAAGSTSGVAYSGARLAVVTEDPDQSGGLVDGALRAAVRSGDPRAVALALEAVSLTTPDPQEAARALGAAGALRAAACERPAEPQERVLRRRRQELVDALGTTAYDARVREGAGAPMTEAARR